ncbi:MAG: ABC transporter ATP-binding protein [Firmicutes bacterium]|nr:ABC transporter ATP-binding protein [Bacillota bacterium]
MEKAIIELKHLKKYYGNTRGIEDVSLKIKKGEIYGFIGPNGAGKSTTIRTIMGLINKSSGNIYINGKELELDDIETKRNIGYLPSEMNLYSDMKVKQLFDYHESFYNKNCSKRKKQLVKLLKIDEEKKIEDLSLGNLKKVGIVLSLMHKPEILILDEATSGLDPIMQNIFHDILLEEKEKGTTILYSSHILSEVSSICDKVGFIKDGKIIKEDLIENIKKESYTYLKIKSNEIEKIKKELKLKIYKELDNEVIFINNLNPNELVNKLSKYNIEYLLIEEVPLEDLFINYYK